VTLIPELSVTDRGATLAFWRDLVGFEVLYERPEEGFAMLALGTAQVMIDQLGLGRDFDEGFERPFGRGLNLQIEVPALAPILDRLREAGVALRLPPEERWYRAGAEEWGQRQAVVADPDGYLLRLFEPLGVRPAA
jgi:catechol 2,3-dioxygenase-like lactoylglutathione lyase family enzyme